MPLEIICFMGLGWMGVCTAYTGRLNSKQDKAAPLFFLSVRKPYTSNDYAKGGDRAGRWGWGRTLETNMMHINLTFADLTHKNTRGCHARAP